MKNLLGIALLLLAGGCSATGSYRADLYGSLMHEDELDDEAPLVGGRVSFMHQAEWAVLQIGLGAGQSRQEIELAGVGKFEFDVDQVQLDFGMRMYDTRTELPFRPFIGLGVAPTWTQFDDGADTESVVSLGLYAEIGFDIDVSENSRVGLGYRYTGNLDGDINGEDVDLDNSAIMLSYTWSPK